jgi:hypothetical protein
MEDQMRKHGILALMLASACYAPIDAHAAVTCTLASLSGAYTMTVSGDYASVAGGALSNQISAVGQVTADGAGNLTGTVTMSANGMVFRGIGMTGTYTAASTCTGTATINFTGGGNLPFDIFLSGSGFSGVDYDNNSNIVVTVTR